jgi:Putative Ig domain
MPSAFSRGTGGLIAAVLVALVPAPSAGASTAASGCEPGTGIVYYRDADGDGYGAGFGQTYCPGEQPPGWVLGYGDSNDNDPDENPGEVEVCDVADKDEDSDGMADDIDPSATGKVSWYADADNDGWGNSNDSALRCDGNSKYKVTSGGDSNDLNPNINPGSQEVCDPGDVDEDSDGLVDDADDSTAANSQTQWFGDSDGDGDGDAADATLACDVPTGFTSNSSDPDDSDASNTSANDAPFIARVANRQVAEGQKLTFSLAVVDHEGDVLTFSAAGNLPSGATLNSTTGAFGWKPNFNQAGIYEFQLGASDGTQSSFTSVRIKVIDIPSVAITLSIVKKKAALKVNGSVSPSHPGVVMTVQLLKKRNDLWKLVETKSPKLNTLSNFSSSFARPRVGQYKITAAFPGDADHAPTTKSKSFTL